jgi:hypothetical protein
MVPEKHQPLEVSVETEADLKLWMNLHSQIRSEGIELSDPYFKLL